MSDYATFVERLGTLSRTDRALTFVHGDRERVVDYATLRERSERMGRRLAGMGFRKGDRLVMVMPDHEEFVELLLGAMWAGVVPVPIFPPFLLTQLDAYRSALARVVNVAEPRALVTSDEVAQLIGPDAVPVATMRFADVAGDGELGELPSVHPDDMALLQFTSGSTADPKGVIVSHRNLIANVTAITRRFGVVPGEDRGVSWLPLYHDLGLIGFVFLPILDEGFAWYMPPLDFVRSPTSWCDLVDRVRGTISLGPTFAYGLLSRRATDEQLERWDLSSWRIAGTGAEPIHIETLRAFARRLEPAGFKESALLACYGAAEATLGMTVGDLETPPRTLAIDRGELARSGRAVEASKDDPEADEIVSCGSALADHEVAILDATGAQLPELHEGEIAFRGPSVTSGYFREDDATARTYRDGWLHTGDLGFVAGGELYVTGRIKDLLIVGGRNYHPQDLEWCAEEEPGVRRGNVVAFSVDNPERGSERVIVVAEARRGSDPEDLVLGVVRRVRAQIGLVVEVIVAAHDTLPKTSSGKVRRQETRRLYLEGRLQRPDDARLRPGAEQLGAVQ